MATIELIISGKVQGVFYRASAREKAEALGLSGWVKNEPDGSVRLRATGSPEQLQQLAAWCAQGPPRAVVNHVQHAELPEEQFQGFLVIR